MENYRDIIKGEKRHTYRNKFKKKTEKTHTPNSALHGYSTLQESNEEIKKREIANLLYNVL